MNRSAEQLTILLIQIRDDLNTRIEELASFSHFCGVPAAQFRVLNVFEQAHFDERVLLDVDAVFVGGSSEASVLQPHRYPFVSAIQGLLLACIERQLPTFCSCFGFQLSVLALGGEIHHQSQGFEMGTLALHLHRAAAKDPLFKELPDPFLAVSVHRDSALCLPDCCQVLAYSEQCLHAFKHKRAPFWATQFHPEVNRSILVERLSQFKHQYTQGEQHLQQVLSRVQETPESNALLASFIQRVVLA
ncbi:type 1 glutamine amidotransferase [Agarivorans sp. Z349TD_8]|uniref:type 1 glutamine amidotransferase n=1 Tax=Agarivorans sp. Z349TD_8 TaxID=3421434 RepID=UPI003D7DB0BC